MLRFIIFLKSFFYFFILLAETLHASSFDYAKVICFDLCNTGLHLVANQYYMPGQNVGRACQVLLGAGKLMYDCYLLHAKYSTLSNQNIDNQTLTEKKFINKKLFYHGLIQCVFFYITMNIYCSSKQSERLLYLPIKTLFFVAPSILFILNKQYHQPHALDQT